MIRIVKLVILSFGILLTGWIGHHAVNHKLDKLKEARNHASPITAQVRQNQLECLARNIYHEAGYEPFEGKVAVAQVTLNRVASGSLPSDVCKVF